MKLLSGGAFSGVNSEFGGRKRKNQPAFPCIHPRKAEDVAEEDAIGFPIFAIEKNVSTANHGRQSSSWPGWG